MCVNICTSLDSLNRSGITTGLLFRLFDDGDVSFSSSYRSIDAIDLLPLDVSTFFVVTKSHFDICFKMSELASSPVARVSTFD